MDMGRLVRFRGKPRYRPAPGSDMGIDSIAERIEKDLEREYQFRRDAGSIPV